MLNKRFRKALAILALAVALLPALRLLVQFRTRPSVGVNHDDGVYWIAARSLALSGEYRIDSLPGRPWQTKYPPLYPLLLSLVWRIDRAFPANLPLAVTMQWLLIPVTLFAAYFLLRSLKLEPPLAILICALLAVNPFVTIYGTILVSEMLYLSLLFASTAVLAAAGRGTGWWRAAAAGALAGGAYLTRVAALLLLPVGVAHLVLARRYRQAAIYAFFMLPAIVGWTLWSNTHRSADPSLLYYSSYSGQYLATLSFRTLPRAVWSNLGDLVNSAATLLVPHITEVPFAQPFVYLLLAAGIAGTLRLVKQQGWHPFHLFALLYAGILLIWNWTPSERLTLPLLPPMLAGVAVEVRHFVSLTPVRRGGAIAAVVYSAIALVFFGANLWTQSSLVPDSLQTQYDASESDREIYRWIRGSTPPSATFMTWSDVPLYLYTGRQAIRPPLSREFEEMSEAAVSAWSARAQATGELLLLSASDFAGERREERLQRLLSQVTARTRFRPVYQTSHAAILQLDPATPAVIARDP